MVSLVAIREERSGVACRVYHHWCVFPVPRQRDRDRVCPAPRGRSVGTAEAKVSLAAPESTRLLIDRIDSKRRKSLSVFGIRRKQLIGPGESHSSSRCGLVKNWQDFCVLLRVLIVLPPNPICDHKVSRNWGYEDDEIFVVRVIRDRV